jgi:lipid A disaccharide synthetase
MTPTGHIVLCAGELSGDMHAAHVVAQLARRGAPGVVGMGGAHCAEAGMDVRFHHRDYAVIGFTGVLAGLPKFPPARGAGSRSSTARPCSSPSPGLEPSPL